MKTQFWKIVILLSIIWGSCMSQNLVSNHSFETFTNCPTGPCQWYRCVGWNNVNMVAGCTVGPWPGTPVGTPDYIRTCGTGGTAPPNTFQGTCTPVSGNAMMAFILYNNSYADAREYISTQLTCSMVAGNTYTLSFWLSNGTIPLSPWTIRNIGVHFSPTALTQTNLNLINLAPTCEITTSVASTTWTQYTFAVTPTVNCRYMTIGSFRPDSQNSPTLTYTNTPNNIPAYNYACYFIDSVVVKPPVLSLSVAITQPNCNSSVASVTAVPSTTNIALNYSWTPGNYTTAAVSGLAPGVYTVTATNPCYTSSASTVFTIVPAPPVVPIGVQNYTFCSNATLTIPISASSSFSASPVSYSWSGSNIQPPASGSLVVVGPTVTSIYTVVATSSLGCPNSTTLAVTVVTNCCSQSTVGLTALTQSDFNGTTLSSGSYLLSNNVTVGGVVMLSNLEILMMPGVKITLPANKSLVLTNTHLYACGVKMWQGIELLDNSLFIGNPYNLIEDAEVAIDIPNTSLATTQNGPIQPAFHNMIFNKNYIGIRVRNADPTITSYPLSVQACVFTSRDLAFTSLSWPNTTTSGLRSVSSPTTGLAPPYNLQGYPMANLKWPHNSIPGYIGIKIEDVGNTPGGMPNPGVIIGSTSAAIMNSPTIFNLFDGLGKGIEVTDASLTAMNNVFQNMKNFLENGNWTYGRGIHHSVTGLMNARLDLRPYSGTSQITDLGNRFWDCWYPIWTDNVYKTDIEYNIFRSTQIHGTNFGPGSDGICLFTNRFENNIRFNEFNNIAFAVHISPQGGAYDMGSGIQNGVYAGNTEINQNYFGPQVTSGTGILSEFLHQGIRLTGQNALGASWQIVGNAKILSNKLNRVYRGIHVDLLPGYPVEIGGNEILVKDDNFVFPNDPQYGIYAHENQGELVINQNIVSGQGVSNNRVKLIRVANHMSNGIGQYPQVTLNEVSNAYKGFAFEGTQQDTRWECNTLNAPINYGFALENSGGNMGVVGSQGGPCMESGNEYMPTLSWTPPNFYTYCTGSNPVNSPLYVALFMASPPPVHTGPNAYTNGALSPPNSFITSFSPTCNPSPVNDCPYTTVYPSLPSQRGAAITGLESKKNVAEGVVIFPNPSSGAVTISGYAENKNLSCKIFDVSGKLVFEKNFLTSGSDFQLNLDLQKGIYLIELKTHYDQISRRKLIIE